MSDQPTPTPADVVPPAPAPSAPEPAAAAPADTPPWGDDFDPEKAWQLVQNLRSDKEKLQKRPSLTTEQQQKLAEYERLEEASRTELEKAQVAARNNEQRAQALLSRAVNAEIKALAGDFADPSDASAFLDVTKYATTDGDVDTETIKADLADLLTRKPHLGKTPTSRVPAPNPAQGTSGAGPAGAKPQLSAEDVKRMYAARDYDGIAAAQADGRLAGLLGT